MTADTPAERLAEALKAVEGHTPGPWHASDRGIGWEAHVGQSSTGGCWTAEARCHEVWDGHRETVDEPTARLIALAPALPAALRLAEVVGRARYLIPMGQPEYREVESALSEFINLLPSMKSGDA